MRKRRALYYALCRIGQVLVTASFILFGLVLVNTFGPAYESRFFPVVRDFKIVSVENYIGTFCIRVEFTKARDCTPYEIQWFGRYEDGSLQEVGWKDLGDGGKMFSRPVGRSRPRKWCMAKIPEAVSYTGFVRHDCRLLWDVTTPFPEIPASIISVLSQEHKAPRLSE